MHFILSTCIVGNQTPALWFRRLEFPYPLPCVSWIMILLLPLFSPNLCLSIFPHGSIKTFFLRGKRFKGSSVWRRVTKMSAALKRNASRGGEHVHGRENASQSHVKTHRMVGEMLWRKVRNIFPMDRTEYAFRKGNSTVWKYSPVYLSTSVWSKAIEQSELSHV